MHRVSTDVPNITGIPDKTDNTNLINGVYKNKFGSQCNNLASILRGLKSAVTTFAQINNIEFDWQPRYYDHIIRDNESFHRISKYIANNPANWNDDKFFQ